jgi:hypothetical protein
MPSVEPQPQHYGGMVLALSRPSVSSRPTNIRRPSLPSLRQLCRSCPCGAATSVSREQAAAIGTAKLPRRFV